jgi:hypothetical protein
MPLLNLIQIERCEGKNALRNDFSGRFFHEMFFVFLFGAKIAT